MHDLKISERDEDSSPLYQRIADGLRAKISSGQLSEGEALPSERELCRLTNASRVTVRKALEQLIEEGLLFRKQGSGTYIQRMIEAKDNHLTSFSAEAAELGEEPGTIWILRTLGYPTRDEAEVLDITTTEKVVRLGRVRLLSGEPLAIEHAIVPARMLLEVGEIGDSLYQTLEITGNRPVSGRQTTSASLATPTEAALLSVAENSAVLRIERLTRNVAGELVELTRSVYRGDRYKFSSDLN